MLERFAGKSRVPTEKLCIKGPLWLDPAPIADYDLAFDCCDLVTAETE
jgi:hypothetical protein|tara:strand:- start:111 stop:254 length:144 start_codon:yes stop_codon:yes gene_type:complete